MQSERSVRGIYPQRAGFPNGILALWGKVALEPLDKDSRLGKFRRTSPSLFILAIPVAALRHGGHWVVTRCFHSNKPEPRQRSGAS